MNFRWPRRRYWCFWVGSLLLLKKECLNLVFKYFSIFVLTIKFWTFWWKRRKPLTYGCKVIVQWSLCVFFGTPCICIDCMITFVFLWCSLMLYHKDVPLLLRDVGALFIQLVLSMPLSMSKCKYHSYIYFIRDNIRAIIICCYCPCLHLFSTILQAHFWWHFNQLWIFGCLLPM